MLDVLNSTTPPDDLLNYIREPAVDLLFRCRAVLVHQMSWHLLCCAVEAFERKRRPEPAVSRTYGTVTLFETYFDAKHCVRFVEASQQGSLMFADVCIERKAAPIWNGRFEEKGNEFLARAGLAVQTAFEQSTPNIPPAALIRPGLPHYPDLDTAARDWLPFPTYHGLGDSRNGKIIFLLPEMRAYFGKQTRQADTLTLEIEGAIAVSDTLLVQGMYRSGAKIGHMNERVSRANVSLPIPADASSYECILLDKNGVTYDRIRSALAPQTPLEFSNDFKGATKLVDSIPDVAIQEIRNGLAKLQAEMAANSQLREHNTLKAEIGVDIRLIEIELDRPAPHRTYMQMFLEGLVTHLGEAAANGIVIATAGLLAAIVASYF